MLAITDKHKCGKILCYSRFIGSSKYLSHPFIFFLCRIPSTPDPSGETMVMNNDEYSRILRNAKVMTLEEKKEIEEAKKQEKNYRMEASMTRKKEMQELELSRKRNEKPSDLEEVYDYSVCQPVIYINIILNL